MDEDAREERLRDQQDGRVYPVGRALRATFAADNHDTLGSDVTGLMIDLSRVSSAPAPVAPSRRPIESATRPSIVSRLGALFGR